MRIAAIITSFAGLAAAGLVTAGLAVPASAQTAAAVPAAAAPVAVIEPGAVQNVLRAGTEIALRMREELTTKEKQARVGQRFQMEVAAPIEMNGVVIIPTGTPAVGEITEVRNKGMWGKSGYINARAISLRLGDRTIRLSGTFDDKGVTGTGGVVAAVAFLPVAGFFTTGTSASIPVGAGVKAFLDEDLPFRTVATVAAPLEVAVPAAAAAVPAGSGQP